MRLPIAAIAFAVIALTAVAATAYQWEPVGMDGIQATCIEADADHGRILVGTVEGFWIYDLATGTWSEFDEEGWIGRTVHAIETSFHDPLRIITGRENAFFKGYLELSLDGGASGEVTHMSQGGAFVDIERFESFYFACGISDITPGELLRSPDGGETWALSTGHGHSAMTAIAGGVAGEICVAGDDQVWYSEDLGATWNDAGAGLGGGIVWDLINFFPGGDVVASDYLAGNDSGLWYGMYPFFEWQPWLEGEQVREIAVAWALAPWPQNVVNQYVVVTADGRVLVQDGGWVDETGNLPAPAVDVAFSPHDDHLYVCTAGGGTHRFQPVILGVAEMPAAEGVAIEAWPNPFNPRATLRFALPREATGRLAVYDLAGRLVTVLAEGDFPAGEHTRTWDAAGQASGVYVARLETEGGSASARLVLVR